MNMGKMTLALGAAALLAAACASTPQAASTGAVGHATLESRSGSTAHGTATFTELSTGVVRVVVEIEGAPEGTHGLHIHEKGDCSAPDATSAGGHFNPGTMPHAGPHDAQRHAGDLGNIEIKGNGKGKLEITTDLLTVKAGPNSVVGRSVIFHEKADDLKTQPTGNAGGRLACGVVTGG
ncbi:MAG TPA: superoxide dismutase family protein [Thermoanaerobaculia bacterium]